MFPFPVPPGVPGAAEPEVEPYHLFAAFKLGPLTLRNRVVVAPMATGFASRQGLPTPRLIAWYGARAAGGAAMVIVEHTVGAGVTPPSAPFRPLRLTSGRALPKFAALAGEIRRAGAVAAIQLTAPAVDDPGGLPATEISRAIEALGPAARLAVAAGFQVIEVQCAYDSLPGQLLWAETNPRRDRYGRGAAGRRRAALEALAVVRRAAGDDVPVMVRLRAGAGGQASGTPAPGSDETLATLAAMGQLGVAAVDVVAGTRYDSPELRLSSGTGEATLADAAGAIAKGTGLPVLANGRILTSEAAERVLREGQASLVGVGRAVLADPAWIGKARAGVDIEIIPCISCLACFTPSRDGGTGCPVNGDAGREHLPPLMPAATPRRIAVLGANLPAMELARVAAARGHLVELATGNLPLGGLLGLRAGVPGDAEFGRAFLYFGDRLRELGVFLVDEPAPEGAPGAQGVPGDHDVVVDCRPGAERRPAWAAGKGVLLAGELLGRDLHEMYGIGRRVAVAGPGALAAEVALFLAGWGRRPTVVISAESGRPFPDVHPMHEARLQERLEGYKIPVVAGAEVVRWVFDEERKSTLVVRRSGRQETLGPFHTAVSAAGWLERHLQPTGSAVRRARAPSWPQRPALPALPVSVPAGATIHLGDTPYPEPLRDLVGYAHLLARLL